jgi:hypothetical protein
MEKTIKRIGHISSNTYITNIDHDDNASDDDGSQLSLIYICVVLILLIIMILLKNYDQEDKS